MTARRQRLALARDRHHHVVAREGARERLGDQVARDPRAGRSSDRGRPTPCASASAIASSSSLRCGAVRVREARRGHDLGRRDVVAGGRLRAHRADPFLEHAAACSVVARLSMSVADSGASSFSRTSSSSSSCRSSAERASGRTTAPATARPRVRGRHEGPPRQAYRPFGAGNRPGLEPEGRRTPRRGRAPDKLP